MISKDRLSLNQMPLGGLLVRVRCYYMNYPGIPITIQLRQNGYTVVG